MILKSTDGTELELTIVSYAAPQVEDDREVANWLLIHLGLKKGPDVWSFTEAALLTWELRDLYNWLERLTVPGLSHGRLAFTRPYLTFEATQLNDDLLSLKLTHTNRSTESNLTIEAELTLRVEALKYALETFKEEKAAFPPRAGVR